MNEDFLAIKSLEGELKLSHKKKDLGLSVSTEELVLQKPHINYHIRLADIVSITPFNTAGFESVRIVSERAANEEIVKMRTGSQLYRFYVRKVRMHNRSGIRELGSMEFVMPIAGEMLRAIARFGQMEQF